MTLFMSKRKKAAKAAVSAMRPLVAGTQIGGVSTFDFYDPYVLGYLGFVGSFFAKSALPNIGAFDLGSAMQDAFTESCNVNGAEMSRLTIELAEDRDENFLSGQKDATISCLYSLGILEDEDNYEIVKSAQKLAMGSGLVGNDFRSAVGGALHSLTIMKRFRELRGGANA